MMVKSEKYFQNVSIINHNSVSIILQAVAEVEWFGLQLFYLDLDLIFLLFLFNLLILFFLHLALMVSS